jgi:SAM-dependent methyltransferase
MSDRAVPHPDPRLDEVARGFGAAAPLYERGRPEYPLEAVRFVVEGLDLGAGARVLDLAAGTGKFTRALLPFGFDLTAIEPTAEMRSELRRRAPTVRALDGTAEAIPMADGSLDAVTVAQAFHWFRLPEAIDEIGRVLRPGGGVAVVFNRRDERVPWVASLGRVVHRRKPTNARSIRDGAWRQALSRHPGFEMREDRTFDYAHPTDPDGIVARVLSVSYVAGSPPEVRQQVADEVRELLAHDPATAGRAAIELPYRTHVTLGRRQLG